MQTELIKNQLKQIRKIIADSIIALLAEFKLDRIEIAEIDEYDAPTLPLPDEYDNSCCYTLDRISIENNKVTFEGSSSCDSTEYDSDNLDVNSMLEILEWLEDHKSGILDYAEEENSCISL